LKAYRLKFFFYSFFLLTARISLAQQVVFTSLQGNASTYFIKGNTNLVPYGFSVFVPAGATFNAGVLKISNTNNLNGFISATLNRTTTNDPSLAPSSGTTYSVAINNPLQISSFPSLTGASGTGTTYYFYLVISITNTPNPQPANTVFSIPTQAAGLTQNGYSGGITVNNTNSQTYIFGTSPPIISYPSPQSYTVNTTISNVSPINTGGTANSYSINTPLPAGLVLNTTTGVISGTPTAASSSTSYTITATNSYGSGSSTFNLSVTVPPPNINYTSPQTYLAGTAISTLSPTNSGGTATSYSTTGLPAGLSLNTSTGAITGTPTTTLAAANYSVTATNSGGNSTANINITVNGPPIVSTNSAVTNIYGGAGTVGGSITATGGSTVTEYGVVYSSTVTTPTTANSKFLMGNGATTTTSYSAPLDGLAPNTLYYVSAYAINATGISYGAVTSFTTLAAPNISYVTPQTYTVGTAISALTPANSGGAVPANKYLATSVFQSANTFSANYFMGFDAAGNMYISDNNGVYKVTPGGTKTTFATGFATGVPTGIAVDPSGNVYMSGFSNNTIYKISPAGVVSTVLTSATLAVPYGIRLDNAGNLYIASYNNGGGASVYKIAAGTSTLTTFATGFVGTYDLSTDNTGLIYVTDRAAGKLYKITSAGVKTQIGAGTYGSPTGITLAADGSIYFADVTGDNVNVVPPGSTTATSIFSTGGNNPRSILLDPTGNFLYISNTDAGSITKLSVTGYTYTGTLPTGLSFDYTTGTITGTPTAVTAPAGNTLTITAYNSAGNDVTTLTIIVNPVAPTVAPVSPVCGAQTVALSASGGLPAGGTYNWYSAASGGTAIATTAAYTPFIGGTTTLYVSYTSGVGTSTRTAVTVTINQKVSSSISVPMISYPFEGGSLTDWSGQGNNAVLESINANVPTMGPDRNGIANGAYYFTGSNASKCYMYSSINYTGNPSGMPFVFSYSLWFKTTSTTGGKLLGFGGQQNGNGGTGDNATQDRNLYMNTTGALYYGVYNGGAVSINTGTATFNDGLWHHVVVTDGPTNGMKIYVDGVQKATGAYSQPQTASGYWRIGGDALGGFGVGGSDYYVGAIDDVAIYNHELTGAEITTNDMNLYNFSSGYCANNPLTITAQAVPNATFAWVDNSNAAFTSSVNPATFATATTTSYTLTTTTPNGCTQNTAIVTPVSQSFTWTGLNNTTNYATDLNWTNTNRNVAGFVPTSTGKENIIIPVVAANKYPLLDAVHSIYTLNIANGASLSLNGFALSVGCNIFNSSGGQILYGPAALASASANASGITWNGTTPIANQSYTGSTTANTAQLGTMVVNNTATGGTVTINSGTLDIYSLLTMTAGNLAITSPAVLTLKSNATQSANVGVIPSANSITGSVNVERYFSGGAVATYRGYRLVSSAVNTNSVTNNTGNTALYSLDFLSTSPSSIFTAGPGGTGSGFTALGAGNSTIYLYREDLPSSSATFNGGNFKGVNAINTGNTFSVANTAGTGSTSTTLPVGNGYMLYYIGDKTLVASKVTRSGGKFADPESSTSTATGTLNQGDVPVKIWFRPNTFFSYTTGINNNISPSYVRGFNLVGNPYPSSIDWDKFTNGVSDPGTGIYGPNLKNSVYVFDYRSKNYGVYQQGTAGGTGTRNSSHILLSGQGFFVKVDSSKTVTAAKLTFHEAAKITTQNTGNALLFKSAVAPQLLRIKLSQDSINADDIILTFEPEAKNEYESDKDADYLQGIGSAVSLTSYAINSNKKLAINHMHSIDETTRIKLYASASSSAVLDTLSATGFDSLDPHFDVYLIDHYKKDSIFFSKYKQYLFNVDRNDPSSYGSDRFELVFHKNSEYVYHLLGFTAKATKGSALLTWKVEKETTFTNFTIERDNGSGQFVSLYTVLSNGSNTYTYLDKSPLTGVNNYRLKQVDVFGNITYSTATLNFNGQISTVNDLFSIYPNPVIAQFNIKITTSAIPKQVQVRVTDLIGNTVIKTKSPGDNIKVNAYNLLPGGYIVEVIDSSTGKILGQKKIIKQ
jgi:streptogramin lyase